MIEVLSFEDGLEKIVEMCPTFSQPSLIAIYSPGPHHGKSRLKNSVINKLYNEKGIVFRACVCDEAVMPSDVDVGLVRSSSGYVFEVAGEFRPLYSRKLIDKGALRLVGKKVDYHVFIYNPKMVSPDLESVGRTVDLIVSNPNSKTKYVNKKN